MHKTTLDQFSPFLLMGIMVLLVAGAAYYVWNSFRPSTDVSAENGQAIARYKDWINKNDLPLVGGKIKTEELPTVYRKVIEHDIKTGDLKSARTFIGHAIQKKLDNQVRELAQLPEAKELIGQMQNAHCRVEVLKQFVAAVQKGEPEPGLVKLADEFCRIPFQPSACPEQADEIGRMYKESLVPVKVKGEAVGKVVGEIEQNCLPRPEPGSK